MGAIRRPVITRDLTATYEGFRGNKRGLGGLGRRGTLLGDVSQGAGLLDGDGPDDRAIEMTSLPPQWIESAEEAREEIGKIKEKFVLLTKAQNKRLLKVFSDDGAPDKDCKAISDQIAQHIRRCEQSIHQVKTRGACTSGKDSEFRDNMQRNLATQLQQLSQQFRQAQKDYAGEIRKRQRGDDLWNGGGGGGSSSTSMPIDMGFTDQQLLEVDNMEGQINQRSDEISQIASSITDLHTIFKELAVLVIDQGSILDRIDYNIEQVVHQSREANVQLQKAEKSQKSNRAMKCLLLLVVANLVLLIILIVKART